MSLFLAVTVMGYIIGTDEAGYGPNLGPLVIAATLWHVPGERRDDALYEKLRDAVTDDPASEDERIVVADSKRVYRPGHGLGGLERGVLAALAAWCSVPLDWDGIWHVLAPDAPQALSGQPWFCNYRCDLPVAIDRTLLAAPCEKLLKTLASQNIRLVRQRARAVFPREFNAQISGGRNKAELLSQTTLALVGELMAMIAADGDECEPVWIVCDKHGGRNRYQEVLQREFPETLICVRGESQTLSCYAWREQGRAVEAEFRVGAEAFLPVAWASMTAKYLRELSMRAFNCWWQGEVAGLPPTAGYPVDAARFRRDIEPRRKELQIDDTLLWRVC